MHRKKIMKLLATSLATQQETADAGQTPAETAIEDALTGKRPLSTTEREALLRSAAARRQFYFLADVVRAETYARWKAVGIDTALDYQAAAADKVEPLSIDTNPDFTLTLFPLDGQGERWTLHLRLSERLQGLVSTGIRLVDDQGEIWMVGRPDADGELSGDWTLRDSPLERLRTYRLQIQPF